MLLTNASSLWWRANAQNETQHHSFFRNFHPWFKRCCLCASLLNVSCVVYAIAWLRSGKITVLFLHKDVIICQCLNFHTQRDSRHSMNNHMQKDTMSMLWGSARSPEPHTGNMISTTLGFWYLTFWLKKQFRFLSGQSEVFKQCLQAFPSSPFLFHIPLVADRTRHLPTFSGKRPHWPRA